MKKWNTTFAFRVEENDPNSVCAGARCALAPDGSMVCVFMRQTRLGINDFKPFQVRSRDLGMTWKPEGWIWPKLHESYSVFVALGDSPKGDLYLFGARTPIDQPGEPNWSEATQGLKQNELIWAVSHDGGGTWSEPKPIPMPIPGAAETPGPMCVTRNGRLLACYAPYPTFDPDLSVDVNQVVSLFSDDAGKTWKHGSMMRFAEENSCGAEAWVVELADGRLLGTSWHVNLDPRGDDLENKYTLSHDGGETWESTRSTGILGQSTALTPLPDGTALFVYNQRKHDEPGIYLAKVKPDERNFGILNHESVWKAETSTQSGTSGTHTDWRDFSFGEPAVKRLPDETFLLTFWSLQPDARGIPLLKFCL